MQKGVFNIIPDSGTGDGSISISAPKYTGREAPANAIFRLRKSGGGLETKRVTVSQPAYPEFFRIDTITKRENADGTIDLTINCTSNVLLSSVICGAKEFQGIQPSTGKSWEVSINGSKVGDFLPTMRSDGFGVLIDNFTGSEAYGKVSSYNLVAYLTIPANTDSMSKSYDFYFGVPSWSGNTMPQVGEYNTSKTLDSASKNLGGKIIVEGSGQGTVVISPTSVSFGKDETDSNNGKRIDVRASGTWEVDSSSIPSWLDVWAVSETSFLLVPNSSNTSSQSRRADIKVQLTNGAAYAECAVTQTGRISSSIYMHVNGQNYVEYKSMGHYGAQFTVSSSGTFTLSALPDWMHLESEVGISGDEYGKVLSISVLPLENDTDTRETTVRVTLDDNPDRYSEVTVFQRPTDNIKFTSSSEGTLVQTSTARFGGYYTLTVDAGGTSKELTLGIYSNCIWRVSSREGWEEVSRTSDSITIKLLRDSASSATSHFIGLQGSHNDIVGYNAGVAITWPAQQ